MQAESGIDDIDADGSLFNEGREESFVPAQRVLREFARGDIADVALDDGPAVLMIEICDHFHLLVPAALAFERQVLVADFVISFQIAEHLPAGRLVLEQTDLEQFLPDQLLARIAQQLCHEWIGVGDLSRDGVEN